MLILADAVLQTFDRLVMFAEGERSMISVASKKPQLDRRTARRPAKRNRARTPKRQKHTTGGIPRWSPTLVLVARFSAYVWQSGRDAQFSLTYGRMYRYSFIRVYKN
jgi:hypothetical protein